MNDARPLLCLHYAHVTKNPKMEHWAFCWISAYNYLTYCLLLKWLITGHHSQRSQSCQREYIVKIPSAWKIFIFVKFSERSNFSRKQSRMLLWIMITVEDKQKTSNGINSPFKRNSFQICTIILLDNTVLKCPQAGFSEIKPTVNSLSSIKAKCFMCFLLE